MTAVPVRLSENVLRKVSTQSQCLQHLLVGRVEHIDHLVALGLCLESYELAPDASLGRVCAGWNVKPDQGLPEH